MVDKINTQEIISRMRPVLNSISAINEDTIRGLKGNKPKSFLGLTSKSSTDELFSALRNYTFSVRYLTNAVHSSLDSIEDKEEALDYANEEIHKRDLEIIRLKNKVDHATRRYAYVNTLLELYNSFVEENEEISLDEFTMGLFEQLDEDIDKSLEKAIAEQIETSKQELKEELENTYGTTE